MDSYKWTIVGG